VAGVEGPFLTASTASRSGMGSACLQHNKLVNDTHY
jgi:hypothetical protein